MICVNLRFGERPSCAARGSKALADELESRIDTEGLFVKVTRSVCQNQCELGPSLRLLPGPEIFKQVGVGDLDRVMERVRAKAKQTTDLPPPI
jgi:(2Fe-2S) ferredoxin